MKYRNGGSLTLEQGYHISDLVKKNYSRGQIADQVGERQQFASFHKSEIMGYGLQELCLKLRSSR
jgi:hypothetical protein